jgi:AraC-like DNA-binding protein/mannose-6-phosphate isomerase-like protein (cupin superfamily)
LQSLETSGRRDAQRKSLVPFGFQIFEENRFALDRLDLTFRWGQYGFRVLHCHLATFPPGKTVALHKHSEYEFHFIPRGKGKVILQNKEYQLHAGLFYLTGPDVLHYQEADANESMDELCLHIDIQKIDADQPSTEDVMWGTNLEAQEAQECVKSLSEIPAVPVLDQSNAMQWFVTAYHAWHENQYGSYATMKHAIIQILLRSVQNYTQDRCAFDLEHRDMNAYRYQLATQFVQDNYACPITLEDVSDRLHISARHLQRIFAQEGKQKFREYVESVRLTNVCQLLTGNRSTIEQIAVQSGFTNANYLYYVFKKKLGVTPAQYKTLNRQTNG